MQSATTLRRWLLMLFIAVGITGTAYGQRTVSLRLNTATLPDTLDSSDEVQVRGGIAAALPDGNVIDWNDNTTLKPANIGGDYWDLTFQIPDNEELAFKFYADRAEQDGIGGWEDGDNSIVAAGTGDVDLGLHYFVKGPGQAYDWVPWESKTDSIAVQFRVYMNTKGGQTAGSAPYVNDETSADKIGVRGDPLEGASMLDWGSTKVKLQREDGDKNKPGFALFSGVAYYPTSAAGSVQAFKFFVEPDGWEGLADNRTFTVPAQDSTLHWVYFGDTAPVTVERLTADVTFSVNLSPLESIGVFRRARGDTLQIRGSFNGWGCGDLDKCLLFKQFGQPVFDAVISVSLFPEDVMEYKYFIDYNVEEVKNEWNVDVIPSGWEEPLTTQGSNRKAVFTGEPMTLAQVYNGVFPANVIPAGNQIAVTWSVDMTDALTADDPFDPATDTVAVRFEDPVFSLTQGFPLSPRSDNPDLGDTVDLGKFAKVFSLTDEDQDMVYTGTLTIVGPTYNGIQYKYSYGSPAAGTFVDEQGGSPSELGRRRTRFVLPNPDGSWPAAFAFVQESIQLLDTLPFDDNPAIVTAVEETGGEVPTQISLTQNFPNPFNPTTTFEYSINRTTDVKLRIYDVLGRVVATLVDGQVPAANYRMSFDASQLASGTYIYRLEAAGQVVTKTMVLLK